jgi:hypothetical protein
MNWRNCEHSFFDVAGVLCSNVGAKKEHSK